MISDPPALIIVDMQRYYLESASPFARYHSCIDPGCLNYIRERSETFVIPNCGRLIAAVRKVGGPVIYLRLCGLAEDRSDLHRTFCAVHREAEEKGFPSLYPLESDPMSEVIPALASPHRENEFCKTTYSAFTSAPKFEEFLVANHCRTLVFTGLATSQCVETTARDAADRDYRIIHVDDAQADYSETAHRASLYSSLAVCGGQVVDTESLLELL